MDRQIVYPAQIPLDSDQLNAQRNTLVGIGHLAGLAYGQNTAAAGGFACTPGGGLTVTLAPGSLLAPGVVDGTAYGTLPASPSALVRQYVSRDPVTLDVPGAGATYIVYVTAFTRDTDDTVLPFYNAADPSVTYAGAGNSGQAAPTVRQDLAQPGVGMAVPPGAYPLWMLTIPAGTTTITADMIAPAAGAPFYDTIPQLQAAKQDALGFTPVQQGGGFDQVAGKIYLGRDTTYPGLRYSYLAPDGETVTGGGYLISSYGPESGGAAGYGQIGDISTDPNGRMAWRLPALGAAYITGALYSDVTAETLRASNIEATLVSGTAGMVSGDQQGTGLHYSNGRMYALYTGGDGFLAWYGDVTNETIRATNAEAQLLPLQNTGPANIDYGGPSLPYSLRLQTDGNLVVYYGNSPIFSVNNEIINLSVSTLVGEATLSYNPVPLSQANSLVSAEAVARANADATLVSGTIGVNAANSDTNGVSLYRNGGSGRPTFIYSSGTGTLAGDLAWAGDLPTSGTIAGGVYTKIGSVLRQSFSPGTIDNGTTITFPIAFSSVPSSIQLSVDQGRGGSAPVVINPVVGTLTATGCKVNIASISGSSQPGSGGQVWVTVEGPA
ncbi:hypothetical protein [Komagataeibacter sp. FNDCR2]|uniref:hypothetical protein n=1 Tax=Komagataeibacter sp. FNDCR2 TaxID=2878682 RepID=UPI001E437D37|nr:hypothetical protein [Komagataeibacter sp. FNDCR2]MCE2574393.1 hypothetical protein [Komagataeibacter sp. FNDCR2]